MKDVSAFLGMRRSRKCTHKTDPLTVCLKTCSASFSPSTECLISILYLELLSGVVEGQQLQQHMI